MRRTLVIVLAAGASLLFVAALHAGGWATVTVRDLPEYAVADTPLPLTFMVREHGFTPLAGLEATVTAALGTGSGTLTVTAPSVETGTAGEYRAALTLPRPGRWIIRVDTVYAKSTVDELPVIASGSPAPAPLPQPALGERLFVAKGCITCHVNGDVQLQAVRSASVGPELTGKRFADAYLKSLLADPEAARGPDTGMPDLELTSVEIAALTAFVNR